MTQHRRDKSSKPDLIVDKVAGSFTDWGVRRYFSRVFSRDYSLLKDIELAGYNSDLERITRETKSEHVTQLEGDVNIKHDGLAKRLNDLAGSDLLTEVAWNPLKSDVLKHMDTGLRIYQDLGPRSTAVNKPGYFLDTNGGKLRLQYIDKEGTEREVINFAERNRAELEKLFPKLFHVDRVMTGQKSMKLTSARFMQMVELAVKQESSVEFHQGLDKNFVSLFRKLEQRMDLQKKQNLCKDLRRAPQLYSEIIKRMRGNITEYLNEPGLTSKQRKILEGIQSFITDPGYSLETLRVVVQENDRYWLYKWFLPSSRVDRDLDSMVATIGQMHTSGSAFLTAAVQAVQNPIAQSETALDEEEVVFPEGPQTQSSIKRYWEKYRVPKTAFDDALQKMLLSLDVSTYVTEGRQQGYEIAEGFSDLPKNADGKTVFDQIRDLIETHRSMPEVPGQTYESSSANLHENISRILYDYSLPNSDRAKVSEQVVAIYQLAHHKLIEGILNAMDKKPCILPKAMITVAKVREKIVAMSSMYTEMIEELNHTRSSMFACDQTTFVNDLDERIEHLRQEQKDLLDKLDAIGDCEEEEFDILSVSSPGQKKVDDVLNELRDKCVAGGVIGGIKQKVNLSEVVDGKLVKKRKFMLTPNNRSKTQDYQAAYDRLNERLEYYDKLENELYKGIGELKDPNKDIPSESYAKYLASKGLFAAGSDPVIPVVSEPANEAGGGGPAVV